MSLQSIPATVTSDPAPISAKTVILEVLSASATSPNDSMPVRRLVRAAAAFDIAENSVRVAIVRLRAEGLLESPERGRYQLGPAAKPVTAQIHGWRTVADQTCPWDGSWVVVYTADLPRTDRPALRRRTRALRLLGFRQLKPGLSIRPNNLRGGTAELQDRLHELGLESNASVFRALDLADASNQRARDLWAVPSLERSYDELRETLAASLPRLRDMSARESIREAFVLGREGIRQLVLDPLLPPELVDAGKRNDLIETVTDYCDRGRVLWDEFLGVR